MDRPVAKHHIILLVILDIKRVHRDHESMALMEEVKIA